MTSVAVVLDFDGTLANTADAVVDTVTRTLAELKGPATDSATVVQCMGLPLRETFLRLGVIDPVRLDEAVLCYRRRFQDAQRLIRLFSGVSDVLRALHEQKVPLAIASSRGRESLISLVRHLGIETWVSVVLGEEDVLAAKPAPDAVYRVAQQIGVSAADVLVVGDTSYDIEMGKAAGARTCGVSYGSHSRSVLAAAAPTYLIDSFDQLPGVVHDVR